MQKSRRAVAVIVIVSLLVPLAAVAMVVAPSTYEVEAKGRHLLDYRTGLVYEVKVAGLSMYVDEETRPEPDLVTGIVLVVVATVATMTALLLRRTDTPMHRRRFCAVTSVGLVALALDEFLGIHETVGYNADFLRALPGIERPDDAVVALYALPVMVVAAVFRDVLVSTTWSRRIFAAALGGSVLAVASDAAALPIEEPLEAVAAICAASGILLLAVTDVDAAIRGSRPEETPLTVA